MKTKVLQSFRQYDVPDYLHRCMLSVKNWAKYNMYDYEFMGDEFFNFKPDYCTATDKWVITDICRLIWLKKELQHYDRVVWADTDFLIFNKDYSELPNISHGFSFEMVNELKSLNNAFMFFTKADSILDIYYEESKLILTTTEVKNRTTIGPELLRNLDTKYNLNKLYNFGLLFNPITTQLLHGYGNMLEEYIAKLPAPIGGVNMCNFTRDLADKQSKIFCDLEFNAAAKLLVDTKGSRLNKRWEK